MTKYFLLKPFGLFWLWALSSFAEQVNPVGIGNPPFSNFSCPTCLVQYGFDTNQVRYVPGLGYRKFNIVDAARYDWWDFRSFFFGGYGNYVVNPALRYEIMLAMLPFNPLKASAEVEFEPMEASPEAEFSPAGEETGLSFSPFMGSAAFASDPSGE